MLITISTVLTVALIPAAFGLSLLLGREPAGRTTYLLQDDRRRAGVVVDGMGTARWEVKTLAAWPRGMGAGTALLVELLNEADREGADMELWCTRFLEDWYRKFGFVLVSQRLGMRRMHRPSPTKAGRPDVGV
ncbi:hypothetical protein ACIA49_38820 [Kribbella sp. NPDC051587]|uniref:hypothetical protein n=1 Tax=Kribbella sp. NPDC051587 TaxID=3364119 RepID=UPI00379E9DFB